MRIVISVDGAFLADGVYLQLTAAEKYAIVQRATPTHYAPRQILERVATKMSERLVRDVDDVIADMLAEGVEGEL